MRRVVGLVLVAAVVISACGGVATVEAEIAGEDWTMFVQTGQSGDSRMAGIEGTVEFETASGCVMVRLSEDLGGSLATVVWPEGTRLAEDGLNVTLPDGAVIADGGTVFGGGGSEPHPDLKKQCPDAFPADSELFVMDSVQAGR